jgi:hypothetical protein
MSITNRGGMAARMLLATMGGLAAMVAGSQGYYHADAQTPKRKKGSGRGGHSRFGSNAGAMGCTLLAHFDKKGICWSAKKNKIARVYGKQYALRS